MTVYIAGLSRQAKRVACETSLDAVFPDFCDDIFVCQSQSEVLKTIGGVPRVSYTYLM